MSVFRSTLASKELCETWHLGEITFWCFLGDFCLFGIWPQQSMEAASCFIRCWCSIGDAMAVYHSVQLSWRRFKAYGCTCKGVNATCVAAAAAISVRVAILGLDCFSLSSAPAVLDPRYYEYSKLIAAKIYTYPRT